jgi:hypothetical protein
MNDEVLPSDYSVSNNFPNPFNPTTRINLTLPINSNVIIEIFDILGRKVKDPLETHLTAGNHSVDLKLDGLSNGMYVARITINEKYTFVKKMMLLYGSNHLTNLGSASSSKITLGEFVNEIILDSLTISGESIEKKTYTDLPNLSGTTLDLGDLLVTVLVSTNTITGIINTNEIGGSDLKIFSVYQDSAEIINNSFETKVSTQGTQILLALDEDNKIRALTLSIDQDLNPNIMDVNVRSTAISQIMLTPGILTVDPVETRETISNILQMTSFAPFENYLQTHLTSISLTDLKQTTEFDSLLMECVNEYYTNYNTSVVPQN